MPSQIELIINRFRADLLSGDERAVRLMLRVFAPIRQRLIDSINELAAIMESEGAAFRLERATALLQQVEDEILRLSRLVEPALMNAQWQAAQFGVTQSYGMVAAQSAKIAASWTRLPVGAMNSLVGRLSNGSPLRSWLDDFGPQTAQKISDALTGGLAIGRHPTLVAADLAQEVDVAGFRLALTTHKAMLDSYRAATLESYRANRDVLEDEWEWLSAKDATACFACLALDGERFSLDIPFQETHLGCRCASIPVLKGVPPIERETASEWFDKQPDSVRNGMIPVSAQDGFADGSLSLEDFVQLDKNPVWGNSYREASVEQAYKNAGQRTQEAA